MNSFLKQKPPKPDWR